ITSAMSSALVLSRLIGRVYARPRAYSFPWSRSQKSGHVHSASSAVQGASASGSSACLSSVVITVSLISSLLSRVVRTRAGSGSPRAPRRARRRRRAASPRRRPPPARSRGGGVARLLILVDAGADALLVDARGAHPLPDLGAGDLGRRRVLHQVADRRRAD